MSESTGFAAMGFYSDHVVPHLINLAMRNTELRPYRERIVALTRGRVLEIGVGSGQNLPLYPSAATEILGLDPQPRLLAMASRKNSAVSANLIEGTAEALPLDDKTIDTIVTTWTLCSIPEVRRALREIRRVLRPEGRLLFVEHGLAEDVNVRRWQQWLTPLWRRIAGGCRLDLPIRDLVGNAGFEVTRIETGYMKGPRPMTFTYEGCARPI